MSAKTTFITGGIVLSLGILAFAFHDAAAPADVYTKPDSYTLERRIDADGFDRVFITATATKLLNCEVQSGNGGQWVDFFDEEQGSILPTSMLYRPDGFPANSTKIEAGQKLDVRGYSTIVPNMLKDRSGTFISNIPCQRWEKDPETGKKVFGEVVIAQLGPFPIPQPGKSIVQAAGVKTKVAVQ
jgi:hypothetical protein